MTDTKRIVLVEDSKNDVELILAALEEYRLANRIVVLRDGAEALDYLFRRGKFSDCRDEMPVLVLLDLKMPKIDGLEVLRQMKADPGLRRVPVVMLTSSREPPDLAASYDLGVNAYVVKPVRFPEFLDAVKKLGVFWMLVNEPPA